MPGQHHGIDAVYFLFLLGKNCRSVQKQAEQQGHFHFTKLVNFAGESFSGDDIFTLERINGYLPQHAQQLVLEWAALHPAELEEDWELARSFSELKKIEPLK
jgi:hypothetical protein